jgi:hypothetical protein
MSDSRSLLEPVLVSGGVGMLIAVIIMLAIFGHFSGKGYFDGNVIIHHTDTVLTFKPAPTKADRITTQTRYITRYQNIAAHDTTFDTTFVPFKINDTLFATKAFESKIDTVINNDSVRGKFCWPEGVLRDYYHSVDTVRIRFTKSDTLQLPPNNNNGNPGWFERYVIPILTLFTGYGAGKL